MTQVLFDHDAHADDLLALAMLQCAEGVRLLGTTVCPGDCRKETGALATRRFLDFFGSTTVPVGAGDHDGINPFPDLWRDDSAAFAGLKDLADGRTAVRPPWPAAAGLIGSLLRQASEPVSLLVTGPPTNVAAALSEDPALARKIRGAWVMGGAVRVPGNVREAGHDGTAEWNFFNHPPAADVLLRSGVPLTLVPLDATNRAPVTLDFLARLRAQAGSFRASGLALAAWQVAMRHIEHADYIMRYFFWDTLTAAAMLRPSLVKTEPMRIRVLTGGASQGRTVEDGAGTLVDVGVDVDREGLERLILELFRK